MKRDRAGAIGLATAALVFGALVGCHAEVRRGEASAPPWMPTFRVFERAETGPITALAVHSPYLWAAGAPGLRRWNLGTGDYEEIGTGGLGSRALAAIAVDDQGVAWVAGDTEVGRWITLPHGELRYEGAGAPGGLTALAVERGSATRVWAGGRGGLYHYDGRGWSAVDGLKEVPVIWLGLEEKGGTWVGTRGHGVFRVETGRPAEEVNGPKVVADEILGMAKTPTGTRVIACNLAGEARLYALTLAGAVGFHAPPGIRAAALVQRGAEALLIAGPAGHERGYMLRALDPGEPLPAGGLRFSPLVDETGARWVGLPIVESLPPDVTVAAVAGNDLYIGSKHLGVGRAGPGGTSSLDGSELVGDAERFSVACSSLDRCFVVTEGPRAWRTDGDRYEETTVGEAAEATVLAVVGDRPGNIYAISAGPKHDGLALTRLGAGQDDWQSVRRLPLQLPPRTAPLVSFAAISPAGVLWLGLRVAGPSGEDVGWGVLETDLETGRTVQHRPRGKEDSGAEGGLRFPVDVNGVFFEGASTWFASLAGVSRLAAGQLESWGENDGLPSELCWGLGRGSNGAIWAATSDGIGRWDGANWHQLGTGGVAVRGIATDLQGRAWAATSRGLRVLAAHTTDLDGAPVVVPGDLRGLATDRFGRIWTLSASSIALIRP